MASSNSKKFKFTRNAPFFVADEAGKIAKTEALKIATNADILLFIINGDLTDSEQIYLRGEASIQN
ncbi:MAG TPA: hypothetical protein VIQ31_09735 [Phormidium sp.]